ncbi:TRAP transporter permease [Halomarina ordinaria]|uniref:TRAP transporter permease n=1 Tax=Halomarina ordinaria TaxID=3033939 RepID=A0ABD5UEW4_9EURY|nr:TRAP transporter fused permease subunit [Halomarina sp. PSRA2]
MSELLTRPLRGKPLLRIKYLLLLVIGVVATAYHLWYARSYPFSIGLHMVIHLGLLATLTSILVFDPDFREADNLLAKIDNAVVIPVEFLVSIGLTYYLWSNYQRLAFESLGIYTDTDILVGGVLILLVLDLSRRTFGWVLTGIAIFGLVYALYGQFFPGILQHQGVSFERLITANTVELAGIYGQILRVGSTYIVIFIIFAGFLEAYGALSYFIDLGARAGRNIRSGVTQTAVIASLGMASVNGSAAANSATTGAFTIPLMKREGIRSETAAAIESVASSGGQVMPPIMGAAAFIMAEITGTGYLGIVQIGLLPALLFYGTIVVAVHLITLKEGAGKTDLVSDAETKSGTSVLIDTRTPEDPTDVNDIAIGTTDEELAAQLDPEGSLPLWKQLVKSSFLWVPVGVLIYTLVWLRYGALLAGFYATISTVPVAFVQRLVLSDEELKTTVTGFVADTLDACRIGIENTAPITMALAVMGLFVGILNLTGFTQVFASTLVDLAGGVLILLAIFAMFAAILFGLGMPTVAAYIVAVLLIAPALVNVGVPLETAHFFVFYFAILSALTPPVAIACIVTTRIANANFWQVCYKAVLLGLPLFVLPYVFLVNPTLLYWEFPMTLVTFFVLYLGLAAISVAVINYIDGPLLLPVRVGMVIVALVALFANAFAGAYAEAVQVVAALLLLSVFAWKTRIYAVLLARFTSTDLGS